MSTSKRAVLDEKKRWKVITMLANGSSRRVAAHYVGVAPSTITRTIERDPEFAEQVAKAESALEIQALRNIRNAAQSGKYWRASAWLLERKNQIDFRERPLNIMTDEEVHDLLSWFVILMEEELPEVHIDKVLEKLQEIIVFLKDEPNPNSPRKSRIPAPPKSPRLPLPQEQPTPIVEGKATWEDVCDDEWDENEDYVSEEEKKNDGDTDFNTVSQNIPSILPIPPVQRPHSELSDVTTMPLDGTPNQTSSSVVQH
jgi:hypothetical protein